MPDQAPGGSELQTTLPGTGDSRNLLAGEPKPTVSSPFPVGPAAKRAHRTANGPLNLPPAPANPPCPCPEFGHLSVAARRVSGQPVGLARQRLGDEGAASQHARHLVLNRWGECCLRHTRSLPIACTKRNPAWQRRRKLLRHGALKVREDPGDDARRDRPIPMVRSEKLSCHKKKAREFPPGPLL